MECLLSIRDESRVYQTWEGGSEKEVEILGAWSGLEELSLLTEDLVSFPHPPLWPADLAATFSFLGHTAHRGG